jgi:predicted O-methyltransferase YrrM
MSDSYKPRFSFEISEEQQRRASKLLTNYGLRKALFAIILNDVLDMIEEHGNIVVGVILDGAAKPREVLPTLNKAERKANG